VGTWPGSGKERHNVWIKLSPWNACRGVQYPGAYSCPALYFTFYNIHHQARITAHAHVRARTAHHPCNDSSEYSQNRCQFDYCWTRRVADAAVYFEETLNCTLSCVLPGIARVPMPGAPGNGWHILTLLALSMLFDTIRLEKGNVVTML
jgi:hypothetical protein